MSMKNMIFRGGIKIGVGQVFSQGCSFIRNIIVARLITPSDFGIAATFAIALSIVEMLSNLAAEKLIIQSQHGDEERFQATVQSVQFLRGIFSGIILFCVAGIAADLFGVPEATWAFRWLSIIPVFRGLMHQDINRLQRQMRFGPSIFVEVISIGVMTVFAYPLGIWLRDYSCMLLIILAQSALSALLSHVFAERQYRWVFDKIFAKEIFTFGWPLIINSILIFGILQGDRFIIGSAGRLFKNSTYTLVDLAIYSVAFTLTFAPTMLIASISTSLFLPILSKCQNEKDKFYRHYKFICEAIALSGGILAIPMVGSGEWIVRIFFGEKYSLNAASLVGWLAVMQSIRIMRIGATLAAMAKGDTKNAMYSNVARSLSLTAVLIIAATGGNIAWIALSGFAGELLAMGVCLWRLQKVQGIEYFACLGPASLVLFFLGIIAAISFSNQFQESMLRSIVFSCIMIILFMFSSIAIFKNLRREIEHVFVENL